MIKFIFTKLDLSMKVLLLTVATLALATTAYALKDGDCEVCIGVLKKFKDSLAKEEQTNKESIEYRFKEYCKDLKLKENRFVSLIF